jgi:hypothetical protein
VLEMGVKNLESTLSWVDNIDELKTMQEVCFKKVKQENLLSIQAEKVNKVYQDLFSKVSK